MNSAVGLPENDRMARLLIHVEGQTEETFVNELLTPHLFKHGYTQVSARLIGNARQRDRRGGICPWPTVRNHILNHLKEDPGCIATTMVDYYALPQIGERARPGRAATGKLPFAQKAATVQNALAADISNNLGPDFNPSRFIPYVMMHEFESLLFSDCESFARGIGRLDLKLEFQAIRNKFDTPEEINDSPDTAPSKRVEALVLGYEKPLYGALAAIEIGIDVICRECPHFRAWLQCLGE